MFGKGFTNEHQLPFMKSDKSMNSGGIGNSGKFDDEDGDDINLGDLADLEIDIALQQKNSPE